MDETYFTKMRKIVFDKIEKTDTYKEMSQDDKHNVMLGVMATLTAISQADMIPVEKKKWATLIEQRDSLEEILLHVGLPILTVTETNPEAEDA